MNEKLNYFNIHYNDYDNWYNKHNKEYNDQINFIRNLIPEGKGIEIGVGTGRFASALGIKYGIDISESMIKLARERNINAIKASAYSIPFPEKFFDFSLNMVTICFLDYPENAIAEAKRVSKNTVTVILDKNSEYIKKIIEKPVGFYKFARFYSLDEIIDIYKNLGFKNIKSSFQDFYIENKTIYRLSGVTGE